VLQVVEHLPSQCEVLEFNPPVPSKEEKKKTSQGKNINTRHSDLSSIHVCSEVEQEEDEQEGKDKKDWA
jgi:hypothetical protein